MVIKYMITKGKSRKIGTISGIGMGLVVLGSLLPSGAVGQN